MLGRRLHDKNYLLRNNLADVTKVEVGEPLIFHPKHTLTLRGVEAQEFADALELERDHNSFWRSSYAACLDPATDEFNFHCENGKMQSLYFSDRRNELFSNNGLWEHNFALTERSRTRIKQLLQRHNFQLRSQ